MTRNQFTALYCFRESIVNTRTSINIRTNLVRKADSVVINWVDTNHNVSNTNDLIHEAQVIGVNDFDWTYLLEHTKRAHLDHFARIIPIENFYPLDIKIEIESLYC